MIGCWRNLLSLTTRKITIFKSVSPSAVRVCNSLTTARCFRRSSGDKSGSMVAEGPPLLVQPTKLIAWLLERKIVQKDYPKRLSAIANEIEKIELKYSAHELPVSSITHYHACLELLAELEKTDNTRDFFGRASPLVRAWQGVVDSYKLYNNHIAECAETIQDLVTVQATKCKYIIADRQKLITQLQTKVKDTTSSLHRKEEQTVKLKKELQLDNTEDLVRLGLLEKAFNIPEVLDKLVGELSTLSPPLNLYRIYTTSLNSDSDKQEKLGTDSNLCSTLDLLIRKGHVLLHTFTHGSEPTEVGPDDDFITGMMVEEKKRIENLNSTNIESADLTIDWDDDGATGIDIQQGIEALSVGDEGIGLDSTSLEIAVDNNDSKQDNVSVATGHSARRLLDTVEGRKALLVDLLELESFLMRVGENMAGLELSDDSEGDSNKSKAKTSKRDGQASAALQNMILQNCPKEVQELKSDDVKKYLDQVRSVQAQLTNSSISQLLMIRSKPGYLDRLVDEISDQRSQADRLRNRIQELHSSIDEAQKEQEVSRQELVKHRSQCQLVVEFIEDRLATICKRKIRLVGDLID